MSRLYTVVGVALFVVLGGCAAADPTGGAFGEPVAAGGTRERPRCAPGEMLTCETKSPNRVSDGRYGYRGKSSMQRCGCQPEASIMDLGQATLPSDKR